MSRPKSDSRRKAILDAARHVCAERGVSNTPTSAISRAAGVAEGTLFTYFKTKDELFNELYLELRRDFDRNVADFPHQSDVRTRLRFVWDAFLNLGISQPARLQVQKQIRASGSLMKENEQAGPLVLRTLEATREAAQTGPFRDAPLELMVLLLRALGEATIEYIVAHPEQEGQCRELGFELIWRGLTGK